MGTDRVLNNAIIKLKQFEIFLNSTGQQEVLNPQNLVFKILKFEFPGYEQNKDCL